MKVFIIAALTADGFIARDSSQSPFTWTSKEDKKRFVELTKRAGVVVMGSETFKTFPQPLKERVNIVYSRSQSFKGAEMTQDEPRVLLQKLAERGFAEVAICGGGQIYTLFMKAGVVTTLYMTVEPTLFGQGLSLFNQEISQSLRLVNKETTATGTIFLEYEVV
ncbi:MAG: dihydrofolate reductase family protein, partial [Candidatus Pacebacteria bacterium]|nr:dihydrofolate reductase family protein [Candidatus Paceibacterota bacterium]